MIYGIGTDIIEVPRIKKQLEKNTGFVKKIFSKREIEYCEPKRMKEQNYAARFAAKEAFFKAIGTGWRGGIQFNEIEILNDELGKPFINLNGKAKEFFKSNKLKSVFVSLSHLKEFATATIVIEK